MNDKEKQVKDALAILPLTIRVAILKSVTIEAIAANIPDRINEEKTGYDCTKWIVDYFYEMNPDRIEMSRSKKGASSI
jgi:hypothetical protein